MSAGGHVHVDVESEAFEFTTERLGPGPSPSWAPTSSQTWQRAATSPRAVSLTENGNVELWPATAPNMAGWSIAARIDAPPPREIPPTARWSASSIVGSALVAHGTMLATSDLAISEVLRSPKLAMTHKDGAIAPSATRVSVFPAMPMSNH